MDRAAVGALLDVKEAALAVADGATVAAATRDFCDRRFAGRDIPELTPPIMLSAAVVPGCKCAVSFDTRRKIEATGHCMLPFFGDIPLDLVTRKEL